MIPNVSLPSPIVLLIPVIASILLGALQEDKLPKLVNAVLAGVFFLVAALACFFLGGKVSSDINVDIWLYVAYLLLVLNYGPCAALRKLVMDEIPSPLLVFTTKPLVDQTQTTQPKITAVRPASVVTNAVVPPKPPQPIVLVKPPTEDGQSG